MCLVIYICKISHCRRSLAHNYQPRLPGNQSDETISDNTIHLRLIVVGAYDPNDKAEIHGGIITSEQYAGKDYLHYLIRFQNTGTDTAFTVSIRDTLEDYLDWNTFEMIDASHSFSLNIDYKNICHWLFNDINLVDSNRNEAFSHGFISFRIQPKNNLSAGKVISNRASIYFDYNLPIQTNIQTTIIEQEIIESPVLSSFPLDLCKNAGQQKVFKCSTILALR